MVRQSGSHRLYKVMCDGRPITVVVAQHGGDIPPGTLRSIERDLEPVFGRKWLTR